MPKLISQNQVSEDPWVFIGTDSDIHSAEQVPAQALLPLTTYLRFADQLAASNCGVWLAADDDVLALTGKLDNLAVIGVYFAGFMDGRSFSQARTLREQLDYHGDIRALGAFIQDQLYFLKRCGVSSFSVADDANIESMSESLNSFSDSYQAACDEPQPLFRRRV